MISIRINSATYDAFPKESIIIRTTTIQVLLSLIAKQVIMLLFISIQVIQYKLFSTSYFNTKYLKQVIIVQALSILDTSIQVIYGTSSFNTRYFKQVIIGQIISIQDIQYKLL
jgi:hypothetical protein